MNKIKITFILFSILFLSGCTATYNISIIDNKIEENLKLIETNQAIFDVVNDSGWTIRESFDSLLKDDQFSRRNYNVKSLNKSNQLGIQYSKKALESVINSSVLNQCYIDPSIDERDGIITIDTGDNFKCYEYYDNLETIKVILKTNHKVQFSNADEIVNGKYIWNITKDSDKRIEFSYYTNFTDKSIDIGTIIVISILLIISGSVIHLIIRKNKKNNAI